ncbi:DUF72 domain-containing protein [Salirhabdus salicampi]|uniref:DUF72 domain-containing protein n=1 Tax=Salirhabdus salicampi TaxID=476102 RepID=UPI0020C52A6F|nr:DUF72 domain-containing protein [Salirhabdus salicampi]
MTIHIGLTGWGDHDSLYKHGTSHQQKLMEYASHFPVVEIDSSFYAIQPERNYQKWVKETPDSFTFVVKAFQALTGHDRVERSVGEVKHLLQEYRESIQPVIQAGKLDMVLFQFPPWFDLTNKNIKRLRFIKNHLADLPLALEFRNRSWFSSDHVTAKTIAFMKNEGWIHSICDEPQAGQGSIPTVLEATHKEKTLIRFHGRNVHGWKKNGRHNWREVRFLYNYNEDELLQWRNWLHQLKEDSKHITVLFNNNSGGDAANNAKQLQSLLGIEYEGLHPRQMNLFGGS